MKKNNTTLALIKEGHIITLKPHKGAEWLYTTKGMQDEDGQYIETANPREKISRYKVIKKALNEGWELYALCDKCLLTRLIYDPDYVSPHLAPYL